MARIVIFADVDLAPEELLADFSHEGLAARPKLGTVGLWCALHGEAFLQAGMHHLECQFDFDALKAQNGIDRGNQDNEAIYKLSLPATGVHRRRNLAGSA